jgi:S-formylglutathione hydrolase FrmB
VRGLACLLDVSATQGCFVPMLLVRRLRARPRAHALAQHVLCPPALAAPPGPRLPFIHRAQLKPEAFAAAAKDAGFPVTMRMQEGYDHSYFFMATFMQEHLDWHAQHLKKAAA